MLFRSVVNGELRLRAYRQRMQETLQENRTVLWEQYADFAQVLTNVSRELDSSYGADPLAEQRLIRWLRTIGVEADAAVFRESTGRLRVTIILNGQSLQELPGRAMDFTTALTMLR